MPKEWVAGDIPTTDDLNRWEKNNREIHFGTTEPSPSLGVDGDIYIKYTP